MAQLSTASFCIIGFCGAARRAPIKSWPGFELRSEGGEQKWILEHWHPQNLPCELLSTKAVGNADVLWLELFPFWVCWVDFSPTLIQSHKNWGCSPCGVWELEPWESEIHNHWVKPTAWLNSEFKDELFIGLQFLTGLGLCIKPVY